MIGQWTQCQRTKGCVMHAGHPGACSIMVIGTAGASPPDPRDAEIAYLRAEVARLTEERDGVRRERDEAREYFDAAVHDLREARGLAAERYDALAASRALADRLAEALRKAAESLADYADQDHTHGWFRAETLTREQLTAARATLREWEGARRGSEGGGR